MPPEIVYRLSSAESSLIFDFVDKLTKRVGILGLRREVDKLNMRVCVFDCLCVSQLQLKCQIKSFYLLNDYTLQNINININTKCVEGG